MTGLRRTSRSIAISTPSPRATIAAGFRPAIAQTLPKATGPAPVWTSARLSRRMSTGLGGCSGGVTSPGLTGGEHQVVEDSRRQARFQQRAIHMLQQDVTAIGVLDPGPRDILWLGA